MKPLVMWCRWHEARLRLMGRDGRFVWGELAFADGARPFRYELAARLLSIADEAARELDEMGVELKPAA